MKKKIGKVTGKIRLLSAWYIESLAQSAFQLVSLSPGGPIENNCFQGSADTPKTAVMALYFSSAGLTLLSVLTEHVSSEMIDPALLLYSSCSFPPMKMRSSRRYPPAAD